MKTDQLLANTFYLTHPKEAARLLETMPPADAAALIEQAPPQTSAILLRHMPSFSVAKLLTHFSEPCITKLSTHMPIDTLSRVLRCLDAEKREPICQLLVPEIAKPLNQLLQYPEGSVGALMDPRVLVLPLDISVAEALKRFKLHSQHALAYIYIIDTDHTLVGVVNFRELMLAKPSTELVQIIKLKPSHLKASDSQSVIITHPGWQRFHALPVVDASGVFVGAIRYKVLRRLDQSDAPEKLNVLAGLITLGELYWIGMAGLLSEVAEKS